MVVNMPYIPIQVTLRVHDVVIRPYCYSLFTIEDTISANSTDNEVVSIESTGLFSTGVVIYRRQHSSKSWGAGSRNALQSLSRCHPKLGQTFISERSLE